MPSKKLLGLGELSDIQLSQEYHRVTDLTIILFMACIKCVLWDIFQASMEKQNDKAERNRSVYNITGVAGEYFVAAELSRRGWIATVTLKNTPNIDVVATTLDGDRFVNIQVKTRSISNRQGWILNKGIEQEVPQKNFFIAFVDLIGIDQRPDYYLIPKNLFARWIYKHHREWLAKPGKNGRPHVDNPIRAFDKPQFKEFEKYHNNWDI